MVSPKDSRELGDIIRRIGKRHGLVAVEFRKSERVVVLRWKERD